MNQLSTPQVLARIYFRGEAELPASFVLGTCCFSIFEDLYNRREVPY